MNRCWVSVLLDPFPLLCFGVERIIDVRALREHVSGCLGSAAHVEIKVELKAQCFAKSVLRDFPEVTFQNLVCHVYALVSLCQVVLEHCITSCDCFNVAHTNCWKEEALILQDLITRKCYVLMGTRALT